MNRILSHVRSNVVAYLALFVALGGTSYAAFMIRNGSINPVKFNPKVIGGYVRRWASVSADGRVLAGSNSPKVVVRSGAVGQYIVSWTAQQFFGCVPTAGIRSSLQTATPQMGFALAATNPVVGHRGSVAVSTYDTQAMPAALPFYLAVICSTP